MKRPAIAALCTAACGMLAPAPALALRATTVTCGQLVAESIKLANDLVNCNPVGPGLAPLGSGGAALEVAGDDVTIDLNGHTIDGSGVVDGDIGIDNSPAGNHMNAYDGVTIKNGTIREFGTGIRLGGTATDQLEDNRVMRVRALNNGTGVFAIFMDEFSLTKSEASGNTGEGISLFGGVNFSRIERNTASNNNRGIGIIGLSDANRVKGNKANSNLQDGIFVATTVTGTLIDGNMADSNGNNGISVTATDAATIIRRNEADNNGAFGILALATVNDGGKNEASGNGAVGQCMNIDCDD